MTYYFCPDCKRKTVHWRGAMAHDRYRCCRRDCNWSAYTDERMQVDKDEMARLRVANPDSAKDL